MNAWKTADAVVRRLEAAIPVYDVSERGRSLCVGLADGRGFVVDAPFEGALALSEDLEAELTDAGFDVRRAVCRRTRLCELRVRDDVGGWAR